MIENDVEQPTPGSQDKHTTSIISFDDTKKQHFKTMDAKNGGLGSLVN